MVFRALDHQTGALVALKLLGSADSNELSRFRREASVLAELSHPVIVRYVDHGFEGGERAYLAMEWLDGETLSERLARGELSLTDAVTIGRRVARGLAHAHARGVVHRDLKPGNVFLPQQDPEQAKLIDFGIARSSAATELLTSTSVRVGTPLYMSPEQVRGERDLDGRSDLFSLGCVLYRCLTGRAPFAGEDLVAIFARILLDEPPRPRLVRAGVPRALDELVMRLLAKSPHARPPNAGVVAEALESMTPAMTRADSLPPPPSLGSAEHRFVSVVIAAPELGTPPGLKPNNDELIAISTTTTRHGADFDLLSDGSVLALLRGDENAADQAARAVRCALALRRRFPARPVAVASGRGVVEGRQPIGEVIDRAAALLRLPLPSARGEGGAVPVRADDVTAGLLGARFELGRDESGLLVVEESQALEPVRTLLSRETPCVGRERQLSSLVAVFEECASEPVARAVLVTAPAGMGKSRLRYELLRSLRAREPRPSVWLARGDPLASGSTFMLLAQLVRSASGIRDAQPSEVKRAQLVSLAGEHLPADAARRVAEFLGELVGAEFPDDASEPLRAARRDPIIMGDQLRQAWEDLVGAVAGSGPVVIVLEDLHWGDRASVSFLDSTLRVFAARPILVFALARPEVHETFPRLWADRGLEEMRLGKLTRGASERLVRAVLGDGPSATEVERIVERADGNALYLEELIRAQAEGRTGDAPETVLALLQSRLESLEPEARRLLRAASVFGTTFWESGVRELLGSAHARDTTEWLGTLAAREVISRRGDSKFPGQAEHVFRHALWREAVYRALTPDDLALGHRLAGEWLERAGERDPMALAVHYDRGGDPARARAQYARAAELALEGNDFQSCLEHAERAVALGASAEFLGHLRQLQAEAARWAGRLSDAGRYGSEALALLREDTARWYDAAAELATVRGQRSDLDGLLELHRMIDERAPLDTAPSAQLIAWARLAGALLLTGQPELVDALLARARAIVAELPAADPAVSSRLHYTEALLAFRSGELERALQHSCEAAEQARRSGLVRNSISQRANAGYGQLMLGEYENAETTLREVFADAERLGLPHVCATALQNLALVLARLGDLEEGRACARRAAESFRAQADRRMEAASRVYLAQIELMRGELPSAEREARAAVELASNAPSVRAMAFDTLSRALRLRGCLGEALTAAREALAIAASQHGVDVTGLTLAEAELSAENREAARGLIRQARERLLEAALRIQNEERRRCFLERVPDNVRILELARELDAEA